MAPQGFKPSNIGPYNRRIQVFGLSAGPLPKPAVTTSAYFEEGGRQGTPVYTLDQLLPGHRVQGPALLIDDISTIVVEPACVAEITGNRDVRIELQGKGRQGGLLERDPVQLAIFSHRCCAVTHAP